MKFFLNNTRAIARAFAAGYTVCAELGGEPCEWREIGHCPSFRYARRLARWMVQDNPGAKFYIDGCRAER